MRQGVMYAASRGMLLDRVFSIRRANIFEPHRYRHVVGPIRLKAVEGGVAVVHSHFVAVRIMHDGATMLFASGRYLDRIDISPMPFRFSERSWCWTATRSTRCWRYRCSGRASQGRSHGASRPLPPTPSRKERGR